MPRTPDRTPGVSDEEGLDMETTGLATAAGQLRYDGSRWSFYDSSGEFDPRTGAAGAILLPRLLSSNLTVAGDKTALAHNVELADGFEILVEDGGEFLLL